MTSTSLIARLAFSAILVATAIGCAPTLYFGVPWTRTYEFERRVPVVVRSEPAGAMIMTADGTELGPAPLVVEEKVRVRRRQRFHSPWMAALGCVIDASVLSYAWDIHRDSGAFGFGKTTTTVAALLEFIGCGELLFRFAIQSDMPFRNSNMKGFLDDIVHVDERVIPRTVELVARWDGLADARVQLALPTTGTTILRLPRSYTFDEALILWARGATAPLTAERLYRTGNVYRELVAHGVLGAREYAIELFTRYLQLHPTAKYADNARRALEGLRRLEVPKR